MGEDGVRRAVAPPGYAGGAALPWPVKFAGKVAIGALRLPASLLRRAGVNRHSVIEDAESRLLDEPMASVTRFVEVHGRPPRGVLELGPGRLVTRAAAYAALGCGPIWFADAEDDAPSSPAAYARVAGLARARGLEAPDLSTAPDRDSALAACGARLLIGGTEALDAIPPGSIDLIVSDVVLEHVRRRALPGLLAALHRLAAPGSLSIHAIDFHDHIGGALNTRRFAPWFWEGRLVARSGLYVNRLGLSQMMEAFQQAGFAPRLREQHLWPAPPPGADRAHPAVARPPDDDRVAFARIEAVLRG